MIAPPGGLEPPTFRLTAERASQLRHGGMLQCQTVNTDFESLGRLLEVWESTKFKLQSHSSLRYGLGVRIAGSHPAGPGSIPGNGNLFLFSLLTQE